MAKLLGNPGILGQGGYMAVLPGIIPGWPRYLGILGYLDKGGHMTGHPGIFPGWPGYLGIPGYLDKGGNGWPSRDYPGIVVYLGT